MSGPLPRGEDKARTVRVLFDTIAPRYDLVNRVMTLGMDVGWRRRTVRELHLPSGSMVFDLACGTGDLCRELDRAGYRAVGLDFALGMLREARTDAPVELRREGLSDLALRLVRTHELLGACANRRHLGAVREELARVCAARVNCGETLPDDFARHSVHWSSSVATCCFASLR